MKMSRKYKGCMNWSDNEEWFYIDEKNQRFLLTDKAPEEAQRSFEIYTRINWRHYKDLGAKPFKEEP